MGEENVSPDLPEPFVPPEVDLRDLDGFMLNVERLLSSELWALSRHNPEAFRAAVGMWARAWKQVPAASLPADITILAAFADMSQPKLKKLWHLVMRGFVLCRDGRYYHRVLAPEALRAWERKLAYQARREADRKRLDDWRKRQRGNGDDTADETTGETANETRFVAEDTGQGQGQGQRKNKKPGSERPPDPSAYAFFGKVVRLTPADFNRWKANFPHIAAELTGHLESRDAWLSSQDDAQRKRWFVSTATWLSKVNAEASGRNRDRGSSGRALL